MKLFGSIKELVSAVFRKNSQEITLRPNQATTYTASRDIQFPPGDVDHVVVSATSTQTLTGKTIDGDDNTVQDLPITAIKTVVGDANKVLRRDGSGVPQSGNTIPNSSALVTTDATQTLTAKTLDGDDNTVQDLAITSLKTVLADANKVLRRDGSGVPQSGNTIPNTSDLVTTDATQTLSAKTLTSPELDTPLVDDYADFNEESAPGTPASGKVRLYAKTDGKLYIKDDAGTETDLASAGSDQGVLPNYIENPGAESDTSGWATYQDAAGTSPVDGTGGSPTITLTRTTSNPQRGLADFLITKPASNAQGEGVSYDFTLDNADRNTFRYVEITADYDRAASNNCPDGALSAFLYDVTNSALVTTYGDIRFRTGGGNLGELRLYAAVPSSCTSMRLIFHITSTNSADIWTLHFDNVSVKPVFSIPETDIPFTRTGSGNVDLSTQINGPTVNTILYTTGASDCTLTLDTAARSAGRTIRVKKVDSGAGRVIVDAASSETIDGELTQTVTNQYDSITVYSDGTSWHVLPKASASGSGSGELNLIDNPSNATNWAASGAGITVATTTTAAELPLSGVIDSGIKIDPVSGTDYARYRWTMPSGLMNKKLKVEWHQKPESGYASGDLKLEIYKNSASDYTGSYTEFSLSTDSSGTSSIPNATGKYSSSFDSDDGSYYELRIVRTAGTNFLVLSNLIVGPGIQPQGAVIEEWKAYTPASTSNFPTGKTISYWQRRAGDSLFVKLEIPSGGSAGGAGQMKFSIPTGLTVDSTKVTQASTDNGGFGRGLWNNGSDTKFTYGTWDTSSIIALWKGNDGVSQSLNGASIGTTALFFEAGPIPVAEWSGSGTLNVAQNDVEYAWNSSLADANDTTSFAYGPGGSQFANFTANRTRRVRFQTPIQSTDHVSLQVSSNSGLTWVEPGQSDIVGDYTLHNGTFYGTNIETVSATDVTISFFQYRFNSATTYGGAGSAWSDIDNDPVYRWRVVKTKSGAAVGFGSASQTSLGLVKLPKYERYFANTSNGTGSSSTSIPRFSNTIVNTSGGVISVVANDATLGTVVTAVRRCWVNVSMTYRSSVAAVSAGVTLNGTPTIAIDDGGNNSAIVALAGQNATGTQFSVSWSGMLEIGDVIRPHLGAGFTFTGGTFNNHVNVTAMSVD